MPKWQIFETPPPAPLIILLLCDVSIETLFPASPPPAFISPNTVFPPFVAFVNVLFEIYAPSPPFPILNFIT